MKFIIEATRAISSFPTGSSRDLYSAHPSFAKIMNNQSENVLEVVQKVLKLFKV